MERTISASEFKATCLDLFDRVHAGELDRVVITKRGRVVAVLVPPEPERTPAGVFGCMAGTVTVAAGVDLTAPSSDLFDPDWGVLPE